MHLQENAHLAICLLTRLQIPAKIDNLDFFGVVFKLGAQ